MSGRRQRGIATGWLYLIGLILLVGALTGLVVAWDNYTSGLIEQGHDAGVAETKAAYTQRDNAALQAANLEILRLTADVRTKEEAAAVKVAAIAAQLAKEKIDGQAQRARDVADIRAGLIKLRDPGADPAGALACDPRAGTETAAGAARGDGRAPGGLSGASAEFLLGIADDADVLAHQLAAAQAVIRQDRLTCNGP